MEKETYFKRISGMLTFASFGKYSSKLYHKGNAYHASPLGGIVTIACGVIILAVAIVTFTSIFNKDQYKL